jgi:oxygen-independent coproporphyrinogen-3 oxidase
LEKFNLPRAQERFIMGRQIHKALITHGYNEIGIDHYALPDDPLSIAQGNNSMKRNFQGYTDDSSDIVLGFGLSAINQFENSYAQNTIDVPTYRRSIESGRLPTHRGLKLSSADKILRELIMTIMCDFRVDLSRYPSALIPRHLLVGFQQDGLIEIDRKFLKITEVGKPFTRVIAATFDPYLQNQGQRHAKAI